MKRGGIAGEYRQAARAIEKVTYVIGQKAKIP